MEHSKTILGFSQEVAKDVHIPGNVFYRLAMKAKNEVAEAFQAKVANEIIPMLRRTGSYAISKGQPALPSGVLEWQLCLTRTSDTLMEC